VKNPSSSIGLKISPTWKSILNAYHPGSTLPAKGLRMKTITIPANLNESDLLVYIANDYATDTRSAPMTPAQLKKYLDELKIS
jgi:hypothetical protein